jgi:hypothetical protein
MFSAIPIPMILALFLLPQETDRPPEEEWNEMTCEQVKIRDLDAGKIKAGVKVYVDIKYGSRLRHVNDLVSTVKFVPRDWDPSEILRGFKLGDNVRFYGKFTGKANEPGGTFDFHYLKRLDGDDDQFAERRIKLKEGDVDGRLDLGDWARERYEFYGSHAKSLGEKADQVYEKAVEILESQAAKDSFEDHFRIARILHDRMDQRDRALVKLKETCLRLDGDDPELLAYLEKKIRAVRYRSDWVPYEEFKTQEGFTQREDGTWVRDPVYQLEQFVLEKIREPQSVLDDRAETGDVVRGMTAPQVIRAKFVATKGSSAYPDYVLRISLPRGGGIAEVWVYPDAYLFFRTAEQDSKMRLWKDPVRRQ